MHWYRIDQKGGFGLRLTSGEDKIAFEVFTADNLSVPHAPFVVGTDPPVNDMPFGVRYALPSAPFFIRVFLRNRTEAGQYQLQIHQFLGTGAKDAIPLLRGQLTPFAPKPNAPHSLDDEFTHWSEFDAVWFVAPFDTEPDGSLRVTSTITVEDGGHNFGLLVLSQVAGSPRKLVDRQNSGQRRLVSTHTYDVPATGYFLVLRDTGSPFPPLQFRINLESDVSYLYSIPNVTPRDDSQNKAGKPARPTRATRLAQLTCIDESASVFEWGSDDIQINVSSNGRDLLHVPNSDDLQFDDDTRRSLPQLDGLRYVGDAKFELVEMDDLSAADRASVNIPQYADVRADTTLILEPGNGSTLTAKFTVEFDWERPGDGVYELAVNVSQEPPPQTSP
jgi:hypothetical protein